MSDRTEEEHHQALALFAAAKRHHYWCMANYILALFMVMVAVYFGNVGYYIGWSVCMVAWGLLMLMGYSEAETAVKLLKKITRGG